MPCRFVRSRFVSSFEAGCGVWLVNRCIDIGLTFSPQYTQTRWASDARTQWGAFAARARSESGAWCRLTDMAGPALPARAKCRLREVGGGKHHRCFVLRCRAQEQQDAIVATVEFDDDAGSGCLLGNSRRLVGNRMCNHYGQCLYTVVGACGDTA